MSDPADHHAEEVLREFWEAAASETEENEDEEDAGETMAPFTGSWPGLASPGKATADPATAAADVAEGLVGHSLKGPRPALVPVGRAADIPAAVGWSGPVNYENDVARLCAVRRSPFLGGTFRSPGSCSVVRAAGPVRSCPSADAGRSSRGRCRALRVVPRQHLAGVREHPALRGRSSGGQHPLDVLVGLKDPWQFPADGVVPVRSSRRLPGSSRSTRGVCGREAGAYAVSLALAAVDRLRRAARGTAPASGISRNRHGERETPEGFSAVVPHAGAGPRSLGQGRVGQGR